MPASSSCFSCACLIVAPGIGVGEGGGIDGAEAAEAAAVTGSVRREAPVAVDPGQEKAYAYFFQFQETIYMRQQGFGEDFREADGDGDGD